MDGIGRKELSEIRNEVQLAAQACQDLWLNRARVH